MKVNMGLSLILVSILLSHSAHAVSGKVVGQVGMVEGNVLVDNSPVKKTAPVREGSVVEVKRGKATLILGKSSVFYLGQDSKMVVSQFGVKPSTDPALAGKGEESGELDLKFGRTRALIMNTGNEKKDVKIKARAATMGVRGTEVYIDVPKDPGTPTNFFTLEGKADVKTSDVAPPVALNQNQGMSAQNTTSSGGGGTGTGGGTTGGSSGEAPKPAPPTISVTEVKNEIRTSGMQGTQINTPQDMNRQVTQQYMSDQFGMGALPPIVLDPLQDRFTPIRLQPQFCSAASASCP